MVKEVNALIRQRLAIFSSALLLTVLVGCYFVFYQMPRAHLLQYVSDFKQKLPYQVDSNTRVDAIEVEEANSVHFYYTILETKDVKMKDLLEALKSDAPMSACSEPSVTSLLGVTSRIVFHYKSVDEKEVYNFDLNHDKCVLLSRGGKKQLF